MSKIKNGGLEQYSAEPFERQQFGTAGVEGVNLGDHQIRPVPAVRLFEKRSKNHTSANVFWL